MRIYRKCLRGFKQRYQLIVRNIENFAEYATAPLSYVTLSALFFSFFCASFGCSLWLAKTVLAKWMNPTYIEEENKKKILTLLNTVEVLEKQVDTQSIFIETLQQIMQGKPASSTSPLQSPPASAPPAPPTPLMPPTPPIPPTASTASMLPTPSGPMVSRGTTTAAKKQEALPLLTQCKSSITIQNLLLIPPINGMITAPFNVKNAHYGVDIVAKEKDPIKAIADGIVIFSDWSVDTGWVIAIQHYNNLVSICKHCAVLFKKVGNLIRAGDVIALMGNSGELSTNPHLHFELWHEGVALNPEDFYNF